MQIEINTGKATILLVKVPEDTIPCHTYENTLSLRDTKTRTLCDVVGLPSKDWTLIGNAFELTEEQCRELAGQSKGWFERYKNYVTGVIDQWSAKQSFASLLQANKVYKENPEIHPADVDTVEIDHYLRLEKEWKEAQKRTGNWIVLKLST